MLHQFPVYKLSSMMVLLSILLCLASSSVFAVTIKPWEFATDVEGWTGENFSTATNQNFRWYSGTVYTGVIVGTPINSDPHMLSPNSGWSVTANSTQTNKLFQLPCQLKNFVGLNAGLLTRACICL